MTGRGHLRPHPRPALHLGGTHLRQRRRGHLRSRAVRQGQRTASIATLALTGSEPAAPAVFWPEHIGLADLLNHLRPEHRRKLELLYFGGYTHSEVAEELAVPLSTVKTWASAAKRRLARWL